MKFSFLLTTILSTFVAFAGELAQSLKTALKGADRLEITETIPGAEKGVTFHLENRTAIGELVKSLDFIEEKSGIPHPSSGDCRITFYRAKEKLVILTHHQALGLSWGGTWIGESVFTPNSQKAWRLWFRKYGEPRFQDWYEGAIKAKKQETANRNTFLAVFPEAPRKIIEEYDNALDEYYKANPDDVADYFDHHPVSLATKAKLADSIPDRQKLASIISKSLGTLSLGGPAFGHWNSTNHEVELVVRTSDILEADDFQSALDSSDPATLLGVARLFFYGKLSERFLRNEKGPLTAKLTEAVAKHDRGGNASKVFWALGHFSGPEITRTLERICLGDLKLPSSIYSVTQDLSFPHLACLLLSKTDSPRFEKCFQRINALQPEYPDDKIALVVARSHRSGKNLLPETIFDSRSTSICVEALSIFEKQRTKIALDLIITKATTHDWADVRENAVLTIERMTGKTWYQNGKNERAEWHAKDIRKWWDNHKSTFEFPNK